MQRGKEWGQPIRSRGTGVVCQLVHLVIAAGYVARSSEAEKYDVGKDRRACALKRKWLVKKANQKRPKGNGDKQAPQEGVVRPAKSGVLRVPRSGHQGGAGAWGAEKELVRETDNRK